MGYYRNEPSSNEVTHIEASPNADAHTEVTNAESTNPAATYYEVTSPEVTHLEVSYFEATPIEGTYLEATSPEPPTDSKQINLLKIKQSNSKGRGSKFCCRWDIANTPIIYNMPINNKRPATKKQPKRDLFDIKNMQNKPNLNNYKFAITPFLTEIYPNVDTWYCGKNKPKQTQFKPISKPIKAHFEAKLTPPTAKTCRLFPIDNFNPAGYKNQVKISFSNRRCLL